MVLNTTAFANAQSFNFETTKFNYQVPQKLVKACKIAQKQNPDYKDVLEGDCLKIDIELLNSNYAWINNIINGDYTNPKTAKEIKKEFNEEADGIYQDLTENKDSFAHSEYSHDIELISTSNRLVQIGVEGYEYHYGTPHGMPYQGFYVFDMTNKKHLKIDDIVLNSNQKQKLEKLAFNAYKQAYKNKMEQNFDEKEFAEHLKTWKFKLDDNFYFTPNGLTISYDPYALGPYAMGFFVLNIDKKDLQGVIKPDYLNDKLNNFNDDDWSKGE